MTAFAKSFFRRFADCAEQYGANRRPKLTRQLFPVYFQFHVVSFLVGVVFGWWVWCASRFASCFWGGTCETRVTRGTFDFQEEDG